MSKTNTNRNNFYCKIANKEEIIQKFDYEISIHKEKNNWKKWKEEALQNINKNNVYIAILNNEIICEATAHFSKDTFQNSEDLVNNETAYLSAFRTNKEYQGKRYFSILFKFMVEDLKMRNIKYATLGVEPNETKNKQIYNHYGFKEYIKTDYEVNPDGTKTEVEYYRKKL